MVSLTSQGKKKTNLLLNEWFGGHLENNHFPEVGFLKILNMLIPTPNTNQNELKNRLSQFFGGQTIYAPTYTSCY